MVRMNFGHLFLELHNSYIHLYNLLAHFLSYFNDSMTYDVINDDMSYWAHGPCAHQVSLRYLEKWARYDHFLTTTTSIIIIIIIIAKMKPHKNKIPFPYRGNGIISTDNNYVSNICLFIALLNALHQNTEVGFLTQKPIFLTFYSDDLFNQRLPFKCGPMCVVVWHTCWAAHHWTHLSVSSGGSSPDHPTTDQLTANSFYPFLAPERGLFYFVMDGYPEVVPG